MRTLIIVLALWFATLTVFGLFNMYQANSLSQTVTDADVVINRKDKDIERMNKQLLRGSRELIRLSLENERLKREFGECKK